MFLFPNCVPVRFDRTYESRKVSPRAGDLPDRRVCVLEVDGFEIRCEDLVSDALVQVV